MLPAESNLEQWLAVCLEPSQIFSGLSTPEARQILSLADSRSFAAKSMIFCAEDPIEQIHLVSSGRVKTTDSNRAGKEVLLRIHQPGEIVEVTVQGGGIHSLSAYTLEPAVMFVWNTGVFERVVSEFPVLKQNAIRVLKDRTRALEGRFCDLATERVPQRLARLLLQLTCSSDAAKAHTPLNLTCEDLAQMTGTTLFTVSRLLCQWAELGIIQPLRRSVVIEDLPALMRVAEPIDTPSSPALLRTEVGPRLKQDITERLGLYEDTAAREPGARKIRRSAERRSWDRLPIPLTFLIRGTDQAGREFLEIASVTNLSAGGVLAVLRSPVHPGSRISLEAPDSPLRGSPVAPLAATVLRCHPSRQHFVVGARFDNILMTE